MISTENEDGRSKDDEESEGDAIRDDINKWISIVVEPFNAVKYNLGKGDYQDE